MTNLTKRRVDAALAKSKDYFLWCQRTPGFGLRVYPSGKKVFVAQVRVGRQLRRVKIGAFGPFTVEQARTQAEGIVRSASEGRDPQREKRAVRDAVTVGELCDLYLKAASAGLVTTRFGRPKRSSTIAIDEGRGKLFIAETVAGRVMSYTVDLATGALTDGALLVPVITPDNVEQANDGSLWVASPMANQVLEIDPDTGESRVAFSAQTEAGAALLTEFNRRAEAGEPRAELLGPDAWAPPMRETVAPESGRAERGRRDHRLRADRHVDQRGRRRVEGRVAVS